MTRTTKEITAIEYIAAALTGVVEPDAVRVKSGKHTLSIAQTFWENDNSYSFAISINNITMAIVWPRWGIAEVFADYRTMIDHSIDARLLRALHDAGYVNMGEQHEFSPIGGLCQTWMRKPTMYITLTDQNIPTSVDGLYMYDSRHSTWSAHCSAVIPGVNGHQCTTYIPKPREGYKTWAVEYCGAHAYEQFGDFGILHTFGAVKLLHEVQGREPIRGSIMDASMWREGTFSIDESPSFEGWTMGQTWNGCACPYFTKETAEEVIAWALSTRDDKEVSEDHEENYDLVMPDPVKTPYGDLYPVGHSMWTWWEEGL